jgi:threonine dehydratase
MPADVPRTKAEKTRAFGAEVLFYDRQREDRVAIAKRLMQERGLVMVPPFEDRWVMAGAGTVALETVQQAAAMGAPLDAMIACCSGGGLAAGTALVIRALLPNAEVLAAEPRIRRYGAFARRRTSRSQRADSPPSATASWPRCQGNSPRVNRRASAARWRSPTTK